MTCCVRCRECGHTAYCLDDRPDTHPCPHGEDLCGDCLSSCEACLVVLVGEPPC